ncbi:50S ribosomal protein L29 [Candidatus Peregrinibacteria bacterium]|nr:50S ribosomal protein L29 [Candidatus Peregrinibacteria bacterium]
MELSELKNMSVTELSKELLKGRKELLKYKIGVKTKQKKEIHLLRRAKKHIAHIQMVIHEKRLAEKGKNT